MAASSLVARRGAARHREIAVHITSVECILTAPAGVGLAVVKVTTSEPGLYGLGCATFTQRLLAVRTVVDDYLAPLLAGRDPQRIEDIWQLVYQNAYWRNGPVLNNALSGVDQALWDIKGKAAGMPLYQLLGGKMRDGAATYAHADGRDPQEVLDRVLELQASGLRHVRCQMGGYGGAGGTQESPHLRPGALRPQRARALRVAARAAWASSWSCCTTCMNAWRPSTPCGWPRSSSRTGCSTWRTRWHPRTSPGSASCVRRPSTPIAIGELFTHPLEWREPIAERLIDFIRVHISDIGGLTPARKLSALAESFGVRTAFHGPADVSPVGHAANVHLDVTLPNFGIQEFTGFPDVLREVFPGGPELRDGSLYPADAPGLGIDLDEELAARYPLGPAMAQFDGGVVGWTQSRKPDGSLARP